MPPLDLLSVAPRFEYIADLIEGQRVLVLGGHGWEGQMACALGAQEALYVDPSPRRVAYARRRCAHPDAMAIEGRWEELPLEAACIDVVLMTGLPADGRARRQALGEARRVLTPDGFLFLSLEAPGGKVPGGRLLTPRSADSSPEIRADLRRHFPHVEILLQRTGLSVSVAPGDQDGAAPGYVHHRDDDTPALALAICSRLMILPSEAGLTLEGLGPLRRALGRQLLRHLYTAAPALPGGPNPLSLRVQALEADAYAYAAQLQALEAELQASFEENNALRRRLVEAYEEPADDDDALEAAPLDEDHAASFDGDPWGPEDDLDADPDEDLDAAPDEDLDAIPDEDLDADPDEDLDADPDEDLDAIPDEDLDAAPDEDLDAEGDHWEAGSLWSEASQEPDDFEAPYDEGDDGHDDGPFEREEGDEGDEGEDPPDPFDDPPEDGADGDGDEAGGEDAEPDEVTASLAPEAVPPRAWETPHEGISPGPGSVVTHMEPPRADRPTPPHSGGAFDHSWQQAETQEVSRAEVWRLDRAAPPAPPPGAPEGETPASLKDQRDFEALDAQARTLVAAEAAGRAPLQLGPMGPAEEEERTGEVDAALRRTLEQGEAAEDATQKTPTLPPATREAPAPSQELQALKDALAAQQQQLDDLRGALSGQGAPAPQDPAPAEASRGSGAAPSALPVGPSWPEALPLALPSLFDGLGEGEVGGSEQPQEGELALLEAIAPENLAKLPTVLAHEDD